MSIEKLLTDLIEAIRENTEALKSGGSAPAKKTPPKKTPPKKTPPKKSAEVTVDDLAKRVGAYLKTGSKAERERAIENVQAIIQHFGAERITKIDPEDFPQVMKLLDAYEAGEDPLSGDDDYDGGDDAGLL